MKVPSRDEKRTGTLLGTERGTRTGAVTFQRLVALGYDAEVSKAKTTNVADGLLTIAVPKKSPGQDARESR